MEIPYFINFKKSICVRKAQDGVEVEILNKKTRLQKKRIITFTA